MILAADVQYGEDGAHAAAVLFVDWMDTAEVDTSRMRALVRLLPATLEG